MIDKNSLYDDLKNFSVPRMAGTQGESNTIIKLKKEIEKSRIIALSDRVIYNFEGITLFPRLMKQISLLQAVSLVFTILGVISFLFTGNGYNDLFLTNGILLLIFTVYFIPKIKKILNFDFESEDSEKFETKNVYTEMKCERLQPFVKVILVSHFDSIGTGIKHKMLKRLLILSAIFLLLAVFSDIFLILISFLSILENSLLIFILVSTISKIILIPILLKLSSNEKNNKSPGACDNASGTIINLNIMRRFADLKLNWVDIRFLFTSAEEVGLFGSKQHASTHLEELKKYIKVYIINIDMVGNQIKFIDKKNRLSEIIKRTALNSKIKIKSIKKIVAGGSDHIPFEKQGFETISFIDTTYEHIHSEDDTPDRIEKLKLFEAYELISRVIMNIDKESEYKIETGKKKL